MFVDTFGNYFQVKEVAANVFGAIDLRWKALALIALQEVVYSNVKIILKIC